MQPKNVNSVLAVGEDFDYDLFRVSISFAENGLNVWFISPNIFDKTPENIKTPYKEVLQLITFLYLKDHNDLVMHLNGIHMWRKLPSLIIVKGYEYYCNFGTPNSNPLQAALVSASLLDSAVACATRKNENISLLVTCTKPTKSNLVKLQLLKDFYFRTFIYKNDHFYTNVTELLK